MSDALTYLYCLVRRAGRPPLRGAPPGLPGAGAPRALAAGDGLWAIVAHVPARDYREAALARGLRSLEWVGARAMGHEAVVEHFLSARAVLPMQLFTFFTSDDRALAHVARDRARIERILARIEGRLEWGLRLTFDETIVPAAPADAAPASGAAYLARKRDLLAAGRTRLAAARAEAHRLYRAMAREASEARRRPPDDLAVPGSRLLLDAAFLVPVSRAGAFRSTLRRRARLLGPNGIVVSLTGPWPPYSFITGPRPGRAAARAARVRKDAAPQTRRSR